MRVMAVDFAENQDGGNCTLGMLAVLKTKVLIGHSLCHIEKWAAG